MAYKTKELEKTALEAILKHNLFFIEDVIAYLPCSKQTFYDHKLDELDTIKSALEANRINVKVKLRKNWGNSDNAALQMGLYKLIGTDKEAHRLNGSKQEIKHDGSVVVAIEYIKPDAGKGNDKA